MAREQVKAIALLSGGLDSALAAALTKRLGFGVVGVNFSTGFCTGQGRCDTVLATGQALGIPVRLLDVAEEYLEVVRYPKFGYGSGMNPCLDCRIFMLRKARELLAGEGAQFVVTGEVLGQRPMSQHYRALKLVADESGLGDRLVRPLSGRLLPPTWPEKQGLVRREDWLDIQGRSRRRQLALAREWGIEAFGQPAGGCCILLEKAYAARLKDAFAHRGPAALEFEDFALLRHGRHFRLSPKAKLIVGRDETENAVLAGFAKGRIRLEFPDVPGPTALVEGEVDEELLTLAACIAARYADAPPDREVRLQVFSGAGGRELWVKPLSPDDPRLRALRVG
ncbi:TPA: thiamine biosynthesis protein [Candidatus Bipolaricaulota bacterium]|nr:thiamine biosynthesis protein [Candidatus Bipolaricaulota bacterium]